MHLLNGLQVDEWATARYQMMITAAQQDLRARAIARKRATTRPSWLRSGKFQLIRAVAALTGRPRRQG